MGNPEFMTLAQLAKTSGITSARLRAAVHARQIFPDTRLGHSRFYGPGKIAAILEAARERQPRGRPRGVTSKEAADEAQAARIAKRDGGHNSRSAGAPRKAR